MGTLLALLVPFVGPAIKFAESVFTQPKSGETKMGTVVAGLRVFANALISSGQVPAGTKVTDDALTGVIEAVLAGMQKDGTLKVGPAHATGQLYLLQGSITPIVFDVKPVSL